jgi:hypothetical protein
MPGESLTERVRPHVAAAVAAGTEAGADGEAVARCLIDLAVEMLLERRSAEDVQSELEFVARNIGDLEDNAFMRP